MNRITIFANGNIPSASIYLPPNQIILAADGGARHCLKLGIKPQVVIGDFDSLLDEEIAALEADNITLIRYPKDKDNTDLELAIDYAARELDARQITLYGLLGGRWDMTFANMLLLASPRYAGIKFQVIDGNTTAYILRGGETLDIQGQPGTTVSVIPLDSPAIGVTYQGLQWPLENTTLYFSNPRGVSNSMTTTQAKISLQQGILLVLKIDSVN
ncbi:thiamine diphosphokinase [Chloroflexota bacterium]